MGKVRSGLGYRVSGIGYRASAFLLACVLFAARGAAQTALPPPAPPSAIAAAKAALGDTLAGANLRVYVITVGQGDAVWERYGHNLLWIHNPAQQRPDSSWEWGAFNFNQPHFIRRFLLGNTLYNMGTHSALHEIERYRDENRDVIVQELALGAGQRAAVAAFVHENAREENQYYRYDYYLDNCSTRLRDVLDLVLGGTLKPALTAQSDSGFSYRSETLRLNQHSGLLFLGLDLALGAPADRPLNMWEASFIPMRLRDALRTITVPGPGGATVPLVRSEQVVSRARRQAEPDGVDIRGPGIAVIVVSLAIALVLLACGRSARQGSTRAVAVIRVTLCVVHTIFLLVALLLLFMWLFTRHAFWAWNQHLLLFTPVSLGVIIALLPFWNLRRLPRWVERFHVAMAVVAFCVSVAAILTPAWGSGGPLAAWASGAWLVYLAGAIALNRARQSGVSDDGGGLPPAVPRAVAA